jgi:hypothetical protein
MELDRKNGSNSVYGGICAGSRARSNPAVEKVRELLDLCSRKAPVQSRLNDLGSPIMGDHDASASMTAIEDATMIGDSTVAEGISIMQFEAGVAAAEAGRFLRLIGLDKEPLPLCFALELAARIRFMQWDVQGQADLVPPECRPAEAKLAEFIQEALNGALVGPVWRNPSSVFQKYFATLIYQTAWSGNQELHAPVAMPRRRLRRRELSALAEFLWKHRNVHRN